MTKPRLSATVDPIARNLWKVEVWEAFPSTVRRIYQIVAASDNLAAREGLRRLTVELERSPLTVH